MKNKCPSHVSDQSTHMHLHGSGSMYGSVQVVFHIIIFKILIRFALRFPLLAVLLLTL